MTTNPDLPLSPGSGQCDFPVTPESVPDSESRSQEVELRLGRLRVDDEDPHHPFDKPLTYQLTALGVSVALSPGRDGPVVHVGADPTIALPAGLPVTVTVEDVRYGPRQYAHYLR